jgi:hypothetical protein
MLRNSVKIRAEKVIVTIDKKLLSKRYNDIIIITAP